ncbi:MAG: hypothetical protein QOF51_2593 [Chloroflexota bacterium]|jgi:hypothetical protein|nr:hypothetical protein [Chloroflexota bacterium]
MNPLEPSPRQNLAHWGADRDYPALRFRLQPRRGEEEWVRGGQPSWDRFIAVAADVEIALAIEAARRLGER